MKKLLMSSIALVLFSISILIFQISCKKEAQAQTSNGTSQLNLILYVKNYLSDNSYEYWLANIDGSNQHKVNITLPSSLTLREAAKLTPDGSKIIFSVNDISSGHDAIYSVSSNGGTPSKIIDGATTSRIYIGGVY